MSSAAAFLGVERSFGGRRWIDRGGDARLGLALAQRLGLPELVGRLMAGRGVSLEGAEDFLTPTLRRALPDPSSFLDMDKAAEALAACVARGGQIGLFGDYDVDGATSTALLWRFFNALGPAPLIHIPDRMTEGYGPNAPALIALKDKGAEVVVTVDCGATAHEPLRLAAEAGVSVIVCDHHVGEPALPPALAVVNPNRFDETTEHRTLAAVGVAFLLAIAVNRVLRGQGFYKASGRPEPDLMGLLDIVALGTVADVVPLTGVNRALVTQGLAVLRQRRTLGLRALADSAGLDEVPEAYHLGFIFGPRVNAGGRVGEAGLGARLLTTEDPMEAQNIAQQLHHYNEERRAIEAFVQEEAIAKLESAPPKQDQPLILVAGEGWHPGVIGIVASRLKERYHRPACVVALENGVGKGSGRSVPGVALGDAVIAARQAGLLSNGGGHAMAAGFTVAEDKLADLEAFLSQRIRDDLAGAPLVPHLSMDATLDCQGATPDLLAQVARLGPFGQGNSEPRFVVTPARLVKADVVGAAHVRLILTGPNGGRLKAIAFRCLDTPLGDALMNHRGAYFHLAGHLRRDTWQGAEGVQFIVEDAAPLA